MQIAEMIFHKASSICGNIFVVCAVAGILLVIIEMIWYKAKKKE